MRERRRENVRKVKSSECDWRRQQSTLLYEKDRRPSNVDMDGKGGNYGKTYNWS